MPQRCPLESFHSKFDVSKFCVSNKRSVALGDKLALFKVSSVALLFTSRLCLGKQIRYSEAGSIKTRVTVCGQLIWLWFGPI